MGERFRGPTVASTREEYSRYTVLVIDDNDDFREMSELALSILGFQSILSARNGEEGVRLYVENIDKIDLIILDLNMPIMDGSAFFREFKRISCCRSKRPKVLLSTGSFNSPMVNQLLSEGLDQALPKPVDFDLMKKSIFVLLSSR